MAAGFLCLKEGGKVWVGLVKSRIEDRLLKLKSK